MTDLSDMDALTHGSLFSGIGGFDLAAEWAGWRNLFNCEIDPFCQTVLKYHFPHAKQYTDIRKTDFSVWRERIDVLSGGFPCQPFSQAGKRLGTEDERHLWPEMLRAIREILPRWVVGENVRGIITWSDGLVFEQVCADLEAEGYEVQPYLLPACGVDAPHERYRTWFIAHSKMHGDSGTARELRQADGRPIGTMLSEPIHTGDLWNASDPDRSRPSGRSATSDRENNNPSERTDVFGISKGHGGEPITTDAHSHDAERNRYGEAGRETGALQIQKEERERLRAELERVDGKKSSPDTQNAGLPPRDVRQGQKQSWRGNSRMEQITNWDSFPTQSPVCSRNDGISTLLDSDAVFRGTRPKVRLKSLTFPKWRAESIKAYGNAVVPPLVWRLFDTINRFDKDML